MRRIFILVAAMGVSGLVGLGAAGVTPLPRLAVDASFPTIPIAESGQAYRGGYDRSLADYCDALGRRWRWWRWWHGPVHSDRHGPSDCDRYWSARGYGGKHRGHDGPSVAEGTGGRGGRSGDGPGGGSGGTGGASY